ncbi:class I SAM-dependent methyltransferase [Chlorogloeopsis sp. ULAP01]|uniref:class I SAM-dependent methyltransferase n=1 Tax=Chlorogloeopsis sp. ULAP01 TaxID=3056483 RepID=UPI0025AA9C43|nr:class I SAM-dependent methyltransferase [Chlorogloeopsis sp. ULAP01]MDM9384757.1 class I SAM-dependent methyltransferase [Chlorogloeopsis sp. ULAP01]
MGKTGDYIDVSCLQGVSETLLIPFIARAQASTLFPDLQFQDAIAEDILPKLNIDFSTLPLDTDSLRKNIVRGRIFDRQLRLFLDAYPDATVISLGAGLSTQFYRVDNGHLKWFDIDLSEVIKVKSTLLPQNNRYHLYGCSLTDPKWLNIVFWSINEPVIIICEGVLNFIEPTEVKNFFQMVAKHFMTQTQIIFDYVHPLLVRVANKSKYIHKTSAKFRWGISNIQEVIEWSERFELIDEFSIMSEIGGTKGLLSILFNRITGSHLYAIAQLGLHPIPTN